MGLVWNENYGHHLKLGSVRTGIILLDLMSNYVFSLVALNSLITFSYTTNVREAAGRFFSRLDVMPL
jgi:hypothetical protein